MCSDTKHPVWNESFFLESRGNAILQTPIIVSVYDYDSTLDNIIGQVITHLPLPPPSPTTRPGGPYVLERARSFRMGPALHQVDVPARGEEAPPQKTTLTAGAGSAPSGSARLKVPPPGQRASQTPAPKASQLRRGLQSAAGARWVRKGSYRMFWSFRASPFVRL